MARIVLAEREVWPFVEGGGIGRYVWTMASVLAAEHDVTIVTTAEHAHMRDDARLPRGVAVEFVDEHHGDISPLSTRAHAFSVAVLDVVRELRPDVVEFGDYHGLGFATVHARRGGDPALARTTVAVRVHTSAEMAYALNETPPDAANGLVWAMERFAIRHADVLLWPGGDVLERYRAFYGRVAQPLRLPLPVLAEDLALERTEPPPHAPLRLLYLNRLERRKGILELVDALVASEADVRLTVVGSDTPTAPGETSMRAHLEGIAGSEERIELRERVPHDEVARLMAHHHALAVPTRWETFSIVTREALAVERPVLATPAGAIPDVVIPGRSGWLTRDLRTTLEALSVEEALALRSSARAVLDESLRDADEYSDAYKALAVKSRSRRPPPAVVAVVAVCAGDADVDVTLRSLAAQRGVRVHVTLAVEPAAMPGAAVLLRSQRVVLADGGRLALWRAGARATSAEQLLLLPAGAELAPDFARRTLVALTDDFDYATAFVARGRRPWHAPLGGEAVALSGIDAGASVALARRDVLAREAATERELWSGVNGVVLHEPLVRRMPRRPADPGEPAHDGAPSPEAVAAGFGDLVSARVTA